MDKDRPDKQPNLVLITTIIREAPTGSQSGKLYLYDPEEQKVVRESAFPESDYIDLNDNPRGGLRGVWGMSSFGGKLAIANSNTVFIFNTKWKLLHKIIHPCVSRVHDVYLEENSIWVTSSKNDLLVQLDFDNRILSYVDTRTLQSVTKIKAWRPKVFLTRKEILNRSNNYRDPRTLSEAYSDSAHLNSVLRLKDGRIFISLGLQKRTSQYFLGNLKISLQKSRLWKGVLCLDRVVKKAFFSKEGQNRESLFLVISHGFSTIISLGENTMPEVILTLPGTTHPAHSIRQLSDGNVIYLCTTTGELILLDPADGRILNKWQIGERYLRGACELPDHSALLGDHCDVVRFNPTSQKVESRVTITENRKEAIYDIHPLPVGFSLPPVSFERELLT